MSCDTNFKIYTNSLGGGGLKIVLLFVSKEVGKEDSLIQSTFIISGKTIQFYRNTPSSTVVSTNMSYVWEF